MTEYVTDWTPPEIAEHDRILKEGVSKLGDLCAKHRKSDERLKLLEFELQRDNHKIRVPFHKHTPAEDARQATVKTIDAEIAEIRRRDQLEGGLHGRPCCQARLSAGPQLTKAYLDAIAPIKVKLADLVEQDEVLLHLRQKHNALEDEQASLKFRLKQVKDQLADLSDAMPAARKVWDVKAAAVGFPGQPTVDLPPNPNPPPPGGVISRAYRYPTYREGDYAPVPRR